MKPSCFFWLLLMTLGLTRPWAEATAAAAPLPSQVFVYNHLLDGFDNNAEGVVWSSLGLLDANGRPGTIQANGNITDASGKVLGSAVRDAANNVQILRSADGTREAYNVSAGVTADQAWIRVAPNGTLNIVKHGGQLEGDDGVIREGGGMMLDGGRMYDGFTQKGTGGKGTGAGYGDGAGNASGAYQLTPRPGANITVVLNGCFTAKDPDGAGPQTSVVTSVQGVAGVANASGHVPTVSTQVNPTLTGTAAQQRAAFARLFAAAKAAGFANKDGTVDGNNVGRWIASLPFSQQYATASAVIAETGATLGLTYSTAEAGPGPAGDSIDRYGLITEVGSLSPLTSSYRYTYDQTDDDLGASLTIDPSDLSQAGAVLSLYQLFGLPAPAPSGRTLASGIFNFRNLGLDQTVLRPMDYELDALDGFHDTELFMLQGSQWVPLASGTPSAGVVEGESNSFGIVAAFGIPEPPMLLLVATSVVSVVFASWRYRSRTSSRAG